MTKTEPEGFADFWSIWRDHCRKTDGRGKARPAYQQMIEAGFEPEDIIDGAAWYLRNMTERDAPYIPLAASWLRSERFADDCEKERAYQKQLSAKASVNVVQMARPASKSKWLQEYEAQQEQKKQEA